MSFSYLLPVSDAGLPIGYLTSKAAIREARARTETAGNGGLERNWDRNLVKRNNNSRELYENNRFENYFSESTVRHVAALVDRQPASSGAVTSGRRVDGNVRSEI